MNAVMWAGLDGDNLDLRNLRKERAIKVFLVLASGFGKSVLKSTENAAVLSRVR